MFLRSNRFFSPDLLIGIKDERLLISSTGIHLPFLYLDFSERMASADTSDIGSGRRRSFPQNGQKGHFPSFETVDPFDRKRKLKNRNPMANMTASAKKGKKGKSLGPKW
jgi:hypothetical protein